MEKLNDGVNYESKDAFELKIMKKRELLPRVNSSQYIVISVYLNFGI